jgi:molecular chaperone DnaK
MNRTTIDFGIDLGTTNSAIAVLKDVSAEIIKNNDDQDVTPSAVSYGKNGQLFVGTRAKNSIIDKPQDAYIEFKRRMGTNNLYTFKASGLVKKPEELSSEVLKSLRADVARSALAEEIQAAVITVPAAFELHQCDATRRAAELAGFVGSPLLQEPVAAALAYGFQVDDEKAYWLVYDFGGGTFDAALIKAEEGVINVVHHGGDNFLGGTDIDWAILEILILPQLAGNHDLPDFKRGSDRWQRALLKLKRSVELAKIDLTTKDSTTLTDCVFEDASGDEVDCEEVTLSRRDVISAAEPIIRRSTDICRTVLKEKKLSASAVQKVILVGGPTKAPYFRELLKSALGIPLDFSMDPLTVVAKGAAVFAGTQKLDPKLLRQAKIGEYKVEMLKSNKNVGHETDPLAGGKVSNPDGASVEGFTIELVNSKTQWRSGKVTLGLNGAFLINLLAEKGERNVFTIELRDASGTMQKTVPDHTVYTVGAVVEEQPLIHSMGVALATNEVVKFFIKGAGLPQKKKHPEPFHTARAIKAGGEEMAISVPVVEGENEAADRNRLVGSLDITSAMIRRDLAAGSEVEITLKIDQSRSITVNAYIPILDEEFESHLDLSKTNVTPEKLQSELDTEIERLRSLIAKAEEAKDPGATAALQKIENSELLAEIKKAVSAAKGDPDAAEKADKRLLELKLRLDKAEHKIEWPTMVAKAREWLDDLDKLVKQHGTDQQQQRSNELAAEVEEVIAAKEVERLPRRQKQVEDLYFRILFAIPAYWVNQFQRLEREREKFTNKEDADRLIEMGQSYLEQNNVDGLRNVVVKLYALLPKQVVEDVKRGFGSGLTH